MVVAALVEKRKARSASSVCLIGAKRLVPRSYNHNLLLIQDAGFTVAYIWAGCIATKRVVSPQPNNLLLAFGNADGLLLSNNNGGRVS